MPSETYTGEILLRRRRFLHLAILRLCIAFGYVFVQGMAVFIGETTSFSVVTGSLFLVYCLALLVYRNSGPVRRAAPFVLAIDLSVMITLVLIGAGTEMGIPLLMFYFLIVEAALLYAAREVLLLSTVSIAFYAAWLSGREYAEFHFSFSSFMFMLVVGGGIGYFFAFQSQRLEKRIALFLSDAAGQPEGEMVAAIEGALTELTTWMGCSRAVLAFWDPSSEYYALCRHPAPGSGEQPALRFEHGPEWAPLAGRHMDFHANDVSLTDRSGKKVEREYDLHPFVVQKFEIYNAVGCGLKDGDRPVGRLLIINRTQGVTRSHLQRLQQVAPLFLNAVRHLLVVRRTEHEAYERARGRIADDLHDGPLQTIISFDMRLRIIHRLQEKDPARASEELLSLTDISRKLVGEMRTFVHRMRPMEADTESLGASARRLVDGFQKESGVAVTILGAENGDVKAPEEVSGEILKVAREALHNIYKHAQATHVLFSVNRVNDQIEISIDDNGVGYRFGGKYNLDELDALQLGPRSIKRRVRNLSGKMTLESNPGQGSNLRVSIPVSAS